MNEAIRKKSPRAPSLALDECIERALKIYEKERRHAAPTDVIAQNLGYKSANNGSALSALASLRSFGLLEKAEKGKLAISRDVEAYRFAPGDEMKNELLIKWLKAPGIFNDLLDRYAGGLPSDTSIRYDLIQRGFSPMSAESTLTVFKRSADFAKVFSQPSSAIRAIESDGPTADRDDELSPAPNSMGDQVTDDRPRKVVSIVHDGYDRIPVRLAGGRRAWLEIPTPFYEMDKKHLISQIQLILTEDACG